MICEAVWPEAPFHRAELLRVISEHYQKDPHGQLGVMSRRGWASPKTFCDWKGASVRALVQFVSELISESTERKIGQLVGWANILPGTESIAEHDHHQADVSVVYYVQPGVGAPLEFVELGLEVDPRAGMAVLFPGKTTHRVRPGGNGVDRVSIAFNAILT